LSISDTSFTFWHSVFLLSTFVEQTHEGANKQKIETKCLALTENTLNIHDGTHLQSQHLGGRGRRIESSRPGGLQRDPVTHACNPSYSGDRDQEDLGLKLAWANTSRDPKVFDVPTPEELIQKP
jgi:hypothetical protein